MYKHVREAKGLSYSVGGAVVKGDRLNVQSYLYGYASSQSDKAVETIKTIIDLLKNLPMDEENF